MKLPTDQFQKLEPIYRDQRVCVTGGAGFIGSHLVDALLALGATITVIDDLSNSTLDHIASLIELEPARVQFVQGSILDPDSLNDAVQNASVVFHLAALGSVPRSVEEPQRTWQVNATGTLRVLQAVREHGVQHLVNSSSSSIYGDAPELPKVESLLPMPVSPYAASKIAGEHLLSSWASTYGLNTINLRYFNIFGPRQPADSAYAAVVAAFAHALLAGNQPVIFGDGLQTRDFTFVSNAVLANLLAGASDEPFQGQAVNIGTGQRTSLLELAGIIAKLTGHPDIAPRHETVRAGDVPHSLAEISRARDLVGYEPIVGVEEGLKETIQWWQSQALESKS